MLSLGIIRCISGLSKMIPRNNTVLPRLSPACAGLPRSWGETRGLSAAAKGGNEIYSRSSDASSGRSRRGICSSEEIVPTLLEDHRAKMLASDGTVINWEYRSRSASSGMPACSMLYAFKNGKIAGYAEFWFREESSTAVLDYGFDRGGTPIKSFLKGEGSITGFTPFAAICSGINKNYRGMGTSLISIVARIAYARGYDILRVEHAREDAVDFFGGLFDHRDTEIEELENFGFPISRNVHSFSLDLTKGSFPAIEIVRK